MVLVCLVWFVLMLPVTAFAQRERPVVIDPGKAQWMDVSHTPGAQSVSLVGAKGASGVHASRVKFARGTKAAPHTHPDERYTLVLSGTLYVGFGETFDESKLVAIPEGMLYVAPVRVPHFLWARDGEVIIQESGTNPTATDFVQLPKR